MVIVVANTKLFINKQLNKESWHCSINPGSNRFRFSRVFLSMCRKTLDSATCEPVAIPSYGVIFSVPRLNISRSDHLLWLL